MEWPERYQNSKTKQQKGENEALGVCRKRMVPEIFREFRNIERASARLQIKGDQTHQRNERSDAQVKRDLERGIVLPFPPAPNPDHDEGWHQREFMEKVKEKQ